MAEGGHQWACGGRGTLRTRTRRLAAPMALNRSTIYIKARLLSYEISRSRLYHYFFLSLALAHNALRRSVALHFARLLYHSRAYSSRRHSLRSTPRITPAHCFHHLPPGRHVRVSVYARGIVCSGGQLLRLCAAALLALRAHIARANAYCRACCIGGSIRASARLFILRISRAATRCRATPLSMQAISVNSF